MTALTYPLAAMCARICNVHYVRCFTAEWHVCGRLGLAFYIRGGGRLRLRFVGCRTGCDGCEAVLGQGPKGERDESCVRGMYDLKVAS